MLLTSLEQVLLGPWDKGKTTIVLHDVPTAASRSASDDPTCYPWELQS